MTRVADFIASYLVNLGIDYIFLVSGGGIMHILDGIRCNDKINYVCAHHEQAASLMAEGYSRITQNIGVVLVTTGPGSTNAITGVADAWVDSIPILAISGQAKRSQNIYNSKVKGLRQIGGQEINILPIVRSFTKYCAMVNDPNDIKYHLDRAVYCAKEGRPGPSWLDIPLDVQSATIMPEKLKSFSPRRKRLNLDLLGSQVDAAYKLIEKSQRPVMIIGNGLRLSKAEDNFLQLVDNLKIPVVASRLGQDLMDEQNPYYVGFGGSRGNRAPNFAMQNSDLILSIGSRLANPFIGYEYDLFARGAKKIVVDIDENELELKSNTIKIDLPINCDSSIFIKLMLKKSQETPIKEKTAWVQKCQQWKKNFDLMDREFILKNRLLTIYDLFWALSQILEKDSIVIGDAGSVYYVTSQAFKVKYGQRVIIPAGLGAMGFSLPLGIGAYYASRNSRIIAVTGDGSLQMSIHELQTLVHNKIPLKLFVINNNGYFSIRNTQEESFNCRKIGADPESGVSFPDLEKIANAYGIRYAAISDREQLPRVLPGLINDSLPIICEVIVDPKQQIVPRTTTKIISGKMVSTPLEDMYPYLPRDLFQREMIIKPLPSQEASQNNYY